MKILTRIICCLLLIGIVAGCFAGCGGEYRPTVKLNKYMIIKAEGNNGSGQIVKAELNYELLAKDIAERAKECVSVDENGNYIFTIKSGLFGTKTFNAGNVASLREAAAEVVKANTPKLVDAHYAKTGKYHEDADALKNGDVLPFTWEVDEKKVELLEKLFKIDIIWDDFVYMVSGLKNPEATDG
jgi:hypothetical protein